MIVIQDVCNLESPSTNYLYKPTYNPRRKASYLRLDESVRDFKAKIEEKYMGAFADLPPHENIFGIMTYFCFMVDEKSFKTKDTTNMVKATEDAMFKCLPKGYDDSQVLFSSQKKVPSKFNSFLFRFIFIENPEEYSMASVNSLVCSDYDAENPIKTMELYLGDFYG